MKVVIPGGSGQVGTVLARALQGDGHEVVVLSRAATKASWGVVTWDATTIGPWVKEIDGADVVWLQASTATIYAHRYDAPNDEATGILGGGEPDAPDSWRFSIDVASHGSAS